jgi:hypothetical protein
MMGQKLINDEAGSRDRDKASLPSRAARQGSNINSSLSAISSVVLRSKVPNSLAYDNIIQAEIGDLNGSREASRQYFCPTSRSLIWPCRHRQQLVRLLSETLIYFSIIPAKQDIVILYGMSNNAVFHVEVLIPGH